MIRRPLHGTAALFVAAIFGYGYIAITDWAVESEREAYTETVTRVREEKHKEVEAHSARVDSMPIAFYSNVASSVPRLYIQQSGDIDRWAFRTISFPDNADTMRIIIGTDTLYSAENFWRVLIRYEIERYFRETLKGAENFQETVP